MKNHIPQAGNPGRSTQNAAPAKKPTYIYTEEDLGEGILDVGISA